MGDTARADATVLDPRPYADRLYAAFWQRAAALLLDGILIASIELIIAAFFIMSDRGAVVLSLGAVYYVLGASSGGTLGKRVLGLRIVTEDGSAPGLVRGFARTFTEGLSCIALFAGHLWMLRDRDKQTWYDRLARTYVIRV